MPFNSETGAAAGRKNSMFRPEYIDRVQELAQRGATDEEIADVFAVSVRTIYNWKLAYPAFADAMVLGKRTADERVARSLYQRAVGFHYNEQRAFKVKIGPDEERIELVTIERYMPPQTAACLFWLKIRCPDEWRELADFDSAGTERSAYQPRITLDQAQIRALDEAC